MTFALLLTDIPAPIKRWGANLYTIAHNLIAVTAPGPQSRETLSWQGRCKRLDSPDPGKPHQDGNDPIMRCFLYSLLAGWTMFAAPAFAADRPVVIELFTSQGCPSCPPADGFFEQLAARDDVLALSLHVDYWDYIGWKDTFGSPAHTARQRGYAAAAGRKMVYTPQIIVNGADQVVGTRYREVTDLIDKYLAAPENGIAVQVRREGGQVHLEARSESPREMPLMVQFARYMPKATVEIERGENAGRTITYTNVVTDLVKVAEWDTQKPLTLDIDWPDGAPLAVLLQYPDQGTIEAAAELR